jgi:hypothetical protein
VTFTQEEKNAGMNQETELLLYHPKHFFMNMIPGRLKKFFSFSDRIGVLILFSILLAGCNSNNEMQVKEDGAGLTKPEVSGQSVLMALEIKFKPKVTGEMRDRTIRAITTLFSDSVKAAADILHQDIPLTFYSISKSGDSSTVDLVAKTPSHQNPGAPNPPSLSQSLSTYIQDTTKCNCTKGCGVCFMLVTFGTTPTATADNSPYKFISEIRDMKPERNF